MNHPLPHRVEGKVPQSVPSLDDQAKGEAQLNAHHHDHRPEAEDGPPLERVVLETFGLQWASQQAALDSVLRRVDGVQAVEVNPVSQTATVAYDPTRADIATLRAQVRECGQACAGESVPQHICDPMHRTHPASTDTAHRDHPGPEQQMSEHGDTMSHAGHAEPAGHAASAGHAAPAGASPHEMMGHGGHGAMSMADMVADMRRRFLVAALFSIPILLWSPIGRDVIGFDVAAPFGLRDDVFMLLLSLPVMAYSASIFFEGAYRALKARTLDMMVLVAVGVGAGFLYSLAVTLTGGGEVFYEAATVLTAFVLLGHWFEMRARGGANEAIRTLLDLAPAMATVLRDGEPVDIPTADVAVGDLLLIRPGAKVAVDGVVEEGDSDIDESMVTGESLPVHKAPGDSVIGATLNTTGTIRVRATKVGADTALAQIVKLVQEAQNSKAPGQRLADRAAFWLVFVALIGGTATFLAWYVVAGRPASEAILFAITVVVITCPDALGLATPTAIMVGTGLGAKRGVLFKNAIALETSARIDTVVMDKTGTLTKGEPEVTDVVVTGFDELRFLALVAAVEAESEHPLAQAIVIEAERRHAPRDLRVESFDSVPGHGAIAIVDGHRVVVGNRRLMDREGVDLGGLAAQRDEFAARGRTAVLVAIDGRAAGLVAMADAPRPTASAAVAELRAMGIEVVMLTGDNLATAQRIGEMLGVTNVIADVLPGDKAARVAELQGAGHRVAMVGDGVNDAPALAQSDIGIAIGAGTDVAIETADLVLMRSDPLDVPVALEIGRGTLRKMRQNLGWAIGYNAIALPIAAGVFEPVFGLVLRPEIAALSMSGSSFLVAVNALLLKRLRLPGGTADGAVAGPTV
jgi:Cu2+-exporting ATPase